MSRTSSQPCAIWATRLAARHISDLSPAERADLQAHIQSCAACSAASAAYTLMESAIRQLPPVAPLVHLAPEHVMASRGPYPTHKRTGLAVDPSFAHPRRSVRLVKSLAAVLVVCTLLAGYLILFAPRAAHRGGPAGTSSPGSHHATPAISATRVGPAGTSSPGPSHATATVSPVTVCQTGQLVLTSLKGGAATGHIAVPFSLENHSSVTCTLLGYPTLQLLDAQHKPLRVQIKQTTSDYTYNVGAPQVITLHPGQKAYFIIEWVDMVCAYPPAFFMQVTPPGNHTSFPIDWQDNCESNMSVSPVVSSLT